MYKNQANAGSVNSSLPNNFVGKEASCNTATQTDYGRQLSEYVAFQELKQVSESKLEEASKSGNPAAEPYCNNVSSNYQVDSLCNAPQIKFLQPLRKNFEGEKLDLGPALQKENSHQY